VKQKRKEPTWKKCIPGPSRLTESCKLKLEFAAAAIEKEIGTQNGQTALFWHLLGVAESHLKSNDK
jgi:hypothetical protein